MKRRSCSCCCRWFAILLLATSIVLAVSPEISTNYADNHRHSHKQPKTKATSTATVSSTRATTIGTTATTATAIMPTNEEVELPAMGFVGANSYNGATALPATTVSMPLSTMTIILESPTIPTPTPTPVSTLKTRTTATINTAAISATAITADAEAITKTQTTPRNTSQRLRLSTGTSTSSSHDVRAANLNASNVSSATTQSLRLQHQHSQSQQQQHYPLRNAQPDVLLNITTTMPPATEPSHTATNSRTPSASTPTSALATTMSTTPSISLALASLTALTPTPIPTPTPSSSPAPALALTHNSPTTTATTKIAATNQPMRLSRQLPAPTTSAVEAEVVQELWQTVQELQFHSFHGIDQVERAAHRRSSRQADEEPIDKCRLFVEGDPEKNEFYSPDYPNNYPKNINCTRVITAPKGSVIRLDFRNSFHIEAKEECKFDFLEIRDGQYGFSNQIGKYCGTDFPPEITSKERYLWLHFHSDESIEYSGFTAVYEFMDRNREAPSTDLNCTIEKDGFEGWINSTDVPYEVKEVVNRNKIPLDCIWRIQVQDGWKIQVKFLDFKLSKPNDCETNFLDIFPEQTVMPLRVKNFCGSAGEGITSDTHILHMRFYAEQMAINSTFSILYTAFRDRGAACTEDEYDCEDATCISKDLECNGRDNCKFRWDEEGCAKESAGQSEHVVIIIIVFGLILGGMMLTFLVNCVRKIMHDQKIIREHIRQSKESKLDELGRSSKARSRENINSTIPRVKHSQVSLPMLDDPASHYYREVIPMIRTASKTNLKEREHSILRQRNDMIVQTSFCSADDDNSSQATLEVLSKHSATAPQACDMGCQTRESLFAMPLLHQSSLASVKDKSKSQHSRSRFSTFGYEAPTQTQTPAPPVPAPMASGGDNVRHGFIEMQERQLPRPTFPHLQRIDALPPTPPMAATAPAEICHHHHQHLQHQHQHAQHQHPQHQYPHPAQLAAARPAPSTPAPTTTTTSTTASAAGKSKTPKLSQSTAYIDIRNSAPDVIIMTSH